MSGLPQGADVTADRIALQGIRRTGRINENIPSILQYVCVADLRLMMLERRKRGSFGGRNVTQDHSKISIEVKNRGQQIKRAKLACIKDHLDSVCRQFQMWAITPRTSYNTMDELQHHGRATTPWTSYLEAALTCRPEADRAPGIPTRKKQPKKNYLQDFVRAGCRFVGRKFRIWVGFERWLSGVVVIEEFGRTVAPRGRQVVVGR